MRAAEALRQFKKMQNIFGLASILQLSAHLWPKSKYVPDVSTYDYIIVGGGTAGCVIANRLAEMKKYNILLIEAGGNPPLESLYPGYFLYMKHTAVDWNLTSYKTLTTRYHNNGVIDITQGKMLGGTSSLNYMAYMHGETIDYALWATMANDSSWSYEALHPFFMKSEKLIDKTILRSPKDKALHGTHGRLKVRRFYNKRNEKYLKAFAELGNEIVDNINIRNPLGYTHLLYTCGKKARQSTAYSFLRAVKDNSRLHVMTHALVTEIIFDETNTAVGVKIHTGDNRIINVRAFREVILTAGVIKTPQLLMVSGIGPKEHLRRKGIKVIADLPVGQNLQDYPTVVSVFKTGPAEPLTSPPNPHKMGLPTLDGKVAIDRRKNYPDYEIRSFILDDPETFLQLCVIAFSFSESLCNRLLEGSAGREIFVVLNQLAYPRSRGEVRLRTKNIMDQPIIKLGFYSQLEDLDLHADYLMHFNDILNTTYFKDINAEFLDPQLGSCYKLDLTDINYWRCYASSMLTTSNYISGTCAMGPVVDSKLFVKGIKRLRIADASIIPVFSSSPTAATVIMIAEKASELIKKYRYDQ